jgi:ribosomal protein S18 acetylase RimI-like enzyme
MIEYRTLTAADTKNALALWRATPGVGISQGDTPEELSSFIGQNEGFCWAAVDSARPDELVGTILCGTDGRRGYIYHLAVAPEARRQGVGRELVGRVLGALRATGVQKCHAMVFASNETGRAFWQQVGWSFRDDLVLFSMTTS